MFTINSYDDLCKIDEYDAYEIVSSMNCLVEFSNYMGGCRF